MEKNGLLIVQGGPPICTAAVFTRNTKKSTTVGSNALLSGSFSAGAPAANSLIVNTTAGKSSRAWIYKSIGGANFDITQPDVPIVLPTSTLRPTEVDTWASTDTVNVCTPVAVNIVSASTVLADYNAGINNALFLYNMTIFDPSGFGEPINVGGGVQIVEVYSQRAINVSGFELTAQATNNFTNVAAPNGYINAGDIGNQPPDLWSGYWGGIFGSALMGSDAIISSASSLVGFNNWLDPIFIDANVTLQTGQLTVQNVIYGSGANTINLQGNSHLGEIFGTYVNTFTAPGLVTGIKINGSTTADTHSGANPDVITTGVSCTPANMDAAGVPGCFLVGGASTNKTQ
jgi:hypothetical protein